MSRTLSTWHWNKGTDDLEQFGFDVKKGQYYVRFHQGQKTLRYNPENVDY